MTASYQAAAFDHHDVPRIFCIGRNYARHIEELGNMRLEGAESVVFMKPLSSLVTSGKDIPLPRGLGAVHHEAELVVEIGQEGRDIPPETARAHIRGVGLGIDLTLRDVQSDLKATGEPWERAKAFESSAPLAPLMPLAPDLDLTDLHFEFTVDGQLRQSGHTGQMLVPVADLVSALSRVWQLLPGDLIYTGTPEGVGPLIPGQRLQLSGTRLADAEWLTA